MKQGYTIKVDTSDLIDKINKLKLLTNKNLLSIYKRSLGSAAIRTVVKQARKSFKQQVRGGTGTTAKAISIKTARKSPLILLGAKANGGQLIHIFDNGTESRSTKSGANRGRIIGLNIFKEAMSVKQSDLVKQLNEILQKNYSKAILKKIQ